MIDLHTHLLPGVDDGARDDAQALAVLARFAADGVRVVVCTPHLRASEAHHAPHADHAARFDALAAGAPGGIVLARGWEIMLDEPGLDLHDAALALGGSHAVLVEFPRGAAPVGAARELARLRDTGVVPVLAHPERYAGATPTDVVEWRSAGALMLGDATTLCMTGARARLARALLAAGGYDMLASDNHGDARSLAAARSFLAERGQADVAELLTAVNPERVLRDEAPLPVPPAAVHVGMMTELREWLSAHFPAEARSDAAPRPR